MPAQSLPLSQRLIAALARKIVGLWPEETKEWGRAFEAELPEITTPLASFRWVFGGAMLLAKESLRSFMKSLWRPAPKDTDLPPSEKRPKERSFVMTSESESILRKSIDDVAHLQKRAFITFIVLFFGEVFCVLWLGRVASNPSVDVQRMIVPAMFFVVSSMVYVATAFSLFICRMIKKVLKAIELLHDEAIRAHDDLPFPSDVAGTERYLEIVSRRLNHAIAHHEFANARYYDQQDRKARALLAELRAMPS
jgi:hypothetical protein